MTARQERRRLAAENNSKIRRMIEFKCHECRHEHLLEDNPCVLTVDTAKHPTKCPYDAKDVKWVKVEEPS